MKTIRFWFQNARPISLPQSLMPALVACFLAARYADFTWYLALLSFCGIGSAHLCLNLFDDLFDYLNADQGDRAALARAGFRAQTVKCPALQDEIVNPWQWLLACLAFGAIACAFGLPVFLARGIRILVIVAIVAVLGVFYSAKPLKLSYNGFGELIIGVIFGPLLTIGMCIGASGQFHAGDVLISVCIGLFVVNILYVHSVMDYAADQKCGKKTLAWLVHGETNKYIAVVLINLVPYLLVVTGVFCRLLPAWFFLTFLTLPWSLSLVRSMLAFQKDPYGTTQKKWWYGRFSDWERIKQAGIDWFMLRWLLAQKINTIFSLLCIVVVVITLLIQ